MSITFNADEIFEMAEEIESNGVKFYSKAAENISDSEVRTMLLELVEMEVKHKETFSAMRAELSDTERQSDIFDPENEGVLYLQAMADGHVFDTSTDPSSMLSGDEKVEDILKMGLQAEKDSIAFYLGLKKLVPSPTGQAQVEHIIAEEMLHISILSGKLMGLKG